MEARIPVTKRTTLLLLNCLTLAIGIGGRPLVTRLYYIHGGKSIWLQAWLETAAFPIIASKFGPTHSSSSSPRKPVNLNLSLFISAVLIGILGGAADYFYEYWVKHVPMSCWHILVTQLLYCCTALQLVTQLAFTAAFTFLLVHQRFTPHWINSVVLLTMGAAVLAMHTNSDRPENVTSKQYYMGFAMLLSAAICALMLPSIELGYTKANMDMDYPLVMEFQFVLSLSATLFCTVGLIISKDFKVPSSTSHSFKYLI
ncbi:hypothetical protein Ancab_038354 [Ancistrocladus abbreviatus]